MVLQSTWCILFLYESFSRHHVQMHLNWEVPYTPQIILTIQTLAWLNSKILSRFFRKCESRCRSCVFCSAGFYGLIQNIEKIICPCCVSRALQINWKGIGYGLQKSVIQCSNKHVNCLGKPWPTVSDQSTYCHHQTDILGKKFKTHHEISSPIRLFTSALLW
jgi:hypothetical protein